MSATRSTLTSLIAASAIAISLASASTSQASESRFFEVVIDEIGVVPALLKVRQGDHIIIRNESQEVHRAEAFHDEDLIDDSEIKPNTSLLFEIPQEMGPGKYVLRYGDRDFWYANSIVVEHPEQDGLFNSLAGSVSAVFAAGQ